MKHAPRSKHVVDTKMTFASGSKHVVEFARRYEQHVYMSLLHVRAMHAGYGNMRFSPVVFWCCIGDIKGPRAHRPSYITYDGGTQGVS